jgi:GNAT superfamily N-acetyltransferase
MRMLHRFAIEAVAAADIPEVLDFVMKSRAELFPKLSDSGVPFDLAHFEQVYLHGEGRFLVARDQGQIVASIGYLPYDHRFEHLDYRGLTVVEVVRLFVLARCRRFGLASQLYCALKASAVAAGVQLIYLHTHPFLPGAIEFWRKRDFNLINVDSDPVWQTTHMECRLPSA